MSNKAKIVLAVVITAIVSSSAATFGVSRAMNYMYSKNTVPEGGKLGMVKTVLDERYLYDYDENGLEEIAAEAYVDALDEPYTYYYSPDQFGDYIDTLREGYVGIGIIVAVNDNDEIEVIAPIEGGPAYAAGVLAGDVLKAVEGVEYSGSDLNEAVSVIRGGVAGTSVSITIGRDGEDIDFTIERGEITENSVKSEMLDGNIGYIRISAFNTKADGGSESTSSEFKEQFEQLESEGADRVIIDLRDNPGGVLDEVCSIADMLLPSGIITYTEDKNGKRADYKSDENCVNMPLVVLINENSASASEVLTGALKDYDVATVIGTTSYGKGIVQEVYTFADGSGISLTTAKYYTPNGVCIHEIGIEPDVTVELPDEYKKAHVTVLPREHDTQLQKAVETIKEQ